MAEHDAIDIFSSNLKHLLLVAPVKNKTVMSIDPGFNNGCKVAVLDKHGMIIYLRLLYFPISSFLSFRSFFSEICFVTLEFVKMKM